jgi:hypothetical protein
MNKRLFARTIVSVTVIVGALSSGSVPASAATANGFTCTLRYGHHQSPLPGSVWTITIHDGVDCTMKMDQLAVTATLRENGTSIASDSESCVSCASETAKAVGAAPGGDSMTNHGTWDLIAPVGYHWTSAGKFCTQVSPRELQCTRDGRFTSGKASDLDSVGVDLVTASFTV